MNIKIIFLVSFFILHSAVAWAERAPYEAPPWVPPPPPESRVHLVDNGDGTLTETKTHLMWTQKTVMPISENV